MQDNVRTAKLVLYTILEVIAVLILTAISGLYDFVNWSVSLSRLGDKVYWVNTAVKTTMYSCALLIGILAVLEWREMKDKGYHNAFSIYRDTLKFKNKGFVPYIDDVVNPQIKKEALKKKYELKLHLLDRLSKDEYKLEYKLKLKDDSYEFKSKKALDYYNKRQMYEELSSDDFINENYEIMSVKYKRVNPYAFTEYLDIHITNSSKWKVENHTAREATGHIVRKVIIAFLCATVLGLFFVDPSTEELLNQVNGWIAILIKYVVRVFMIAFNLIMGCFTGKRLFDNNYLLPIINRTRILNDYHTYNEDHPSLTQMESYRKQKDKEYDERLKSEVERIRQEVKDQLAAS